MRRARDFLMLLGLLLSAIIPYRAEAKETGKAAYDFAFKSITDQDMPLSAYKGKVLLIVNTASKCGFTPQYAELQKLYNQYKERGLIIIGVPSNDFGGQEPDSEDAIKAFCEINYGVNFPLTAKYSVIGKEAHPFYAWAEKTFGVAGTPKWNFHKYLIDSNGKLVDYFNSNISPTAPIISKAIEKLLPAENTPPSQPQKN